MIFVYLFGNIQYYTGQLALWDAFWGSIGLTQNDSNEKDVNHL